MTAWRPSPSSSSRPRRVVRTLGELVARATDFADGQRRLMDLAPRSATALAGLAAQAQAAKLLAQLSAPVLPGFAQELWTTLGLGGAPLWDDLAPLTTGTPLGTTRVFFEPLPADLSTLVGRRGA